MFMSTMWHYVYVDYVALCLCGLNDIMFMSTIFHYYVYFEYMTLCLCLCFYQLNGIIIFMSTLCHYYVYVD